MMVRSTPAARVAGGAASVVLAVGLAWGPAAYAEPIVPRLPQRLEVTPEAARVASDAYGRAVKKHTARDIKGAIAEADIAWRTVPNASTALIRATLLAEDGQHLEAFTAYLQGADLDPTEEERALILAGLAKEGPLCTPPRGWVRVLPSTPQGPVRIDGVAVTPPRTIGLEAGDRPVKASATGYETLEQTVGVLAGQERVVQLTLTEAKPEPPVVVTPPVIEPVATVTPPTVIVEPPAEGPPILPWTLVGAGGALAITGGVLVGLAAGAADDAATYALPAAGVTSDERRQSYESAQSDASTFQTAGWVLMGAGVASAVTGAVLLALDPGEAAQTIVTPTPGGVFVNTRF